MSKVPEKNRSNEPAEISGDEFAEKLIQQIGSVVTVSKGQQAQIVARVMALRQQESFSGPIPHPKHLREYEEIHPGSTGILFNQFERTIEHNRECETKALDADISDMKAGRWFGFAALTMLIVSALACAYLQQPVIAGLFLGAAALGTISDFIKGRGNGNGGK